jgi:hypothetical protein
VENIREKNKSECYVEKRKECQRKKETHKFSYEEGAKVSNFSKNTL